MFSYRQLTHDDAGSFERLRLFALGDTPSAFSSSLEEEIGFSPSEVRERLSGKSGSAVMGAFAGRELVGLAGVRREAKRKLAHKGLIWGVYVTPAHRRRGVGRGLMALALEFAERVLELRQVTLGVNAANKAALELYLSLGFVVYGREPEFMWVDGQAQDEFLLVRFFVSRQAQATG